MKHIGTKLFLGFISMTILTIAVIWIIQAGFMNNVYLDQRIHSVQDDISRAAKSGETDYDALAENMNVSLIAADDDGNIVYRSQGLPMMKRMLLAASDMIPEEADGEPQYFTNLSGKIRYAIIGAETKDGSYLFAVFSVADLDEASQLLYQQLWIVTIVLILLSVLLAIFLSGRMSRPIHAVTRAARDLAAGKLDVRLPVKTHDEIGQMTEALNDLSIELGHTESLRHELIANVSHELRAPLAVIQGYAETVRDVSWPNEEKRTEQLNIIADEASRLTRVVKDILDYSRLQAGVEHLNLQSFPVCPVLRELQKQYDLEAGLHKVTIQMDCPDIDVIFDRDRFVQVIHNLLNNAINHAQPDSTVKISAERQKGICRIAVINQGETIPAESLPKIWERYFRADRIGTGRLLGTGLGLAIVKSIFDQHGVRYGVASENGTTVFWFETAQKAIA